MKFLSDILAKAGLVVDGTVTLNSVANATTDTDRFIVVDSGVVKYRTGTQLLSDIGGISGNQTITLSGDATGSGTTSIAVTLANSGVVAGTYGSSTAVPVITVDAKGRVTGVTTASISGSLTFTGDVTGSGTTGSTTTLTLANSGVTTGTYTKVTVDAKGRVTTGTTLSAGDIPSLNYLPISGGTLTGNLIIWPGTNASYGAGLKFRNDGYAHYTVGVKGNTFVLSNTGADGSVVWSASITDLITVTSAGNVTTLGSVTASSIIKSGGTSSQFLKADGSIDSTTYQSTSQKGQANGYASLDGAGKVPVSQLPSSIMEYKGTWNASTNSPTLADGTGDTGDVYRVSTAGTRNLGSGSITFDIGDYVIYNGTVWEKSDTTDAVASVNGFTGIITLTTTNIGEGTNLYYTDTRARAALSFTAGSGGYNSTTGVITIPTNTNQLTNGAGYITGNQNITLSGDVTGSGATSIVTTIANNAVTTAKINNGAITAAKMATFGAGEGFFWAANTDGASIIFESTGDGASGGRALSNLLIALTDNGDEGLKVTTTGSELLYVNINQFQYKGNNVWHSGNLTNLNQLSNGPGYITGYTETDTLASVTGRGASTSTNVTFNGTITANSSIVQGYGTILTGYNSGFQITVNATYSGGQTNTYTPQYAGVASAGMFVMKQRNGGEGIMDFYGKQSGTDGSTQAYSTFNHLMTMLPTGYVGVGTVAPGAKLDIVSTASGSEGLRVDGASGGFAFVVRGGSTYTSHIRAGLTIGANYFTTPPSNGAIIEGNVGIGTSTPQTSLTLSRTNVSYAGQLQLASDNFAQITFYNSAAITPSAANRKASIIYNVAGNTFEIANQISGGHLILQGSDSGGGRVGINIDAPGAILDVSHTAGTTNIIRVSNGAGNYRWRVDQNFSMIMTNSVGTDTFSVTTGGVLTAVSLVKSGGTSSQFLMADGSVSTNPGWITSYTETDTLATVTGRGASTFSTIYVNQTTGGGYVFRTSNSWGGWARNAFSIADESSNILSTLGGFGGAGTSISFIYIGKSYTDYSASFNPDGNVELRYDNTTRLVADSLGVSITGRLAGGSWASFTSSTQGTPIVRANQEDTAAGYYLFQGTTGGTEVFRVDRNGGAYFSGSVGIGTTTTIYGKLSVSSGNFNGVRIDTNAGYDAISIGGTGALSVDAPGIAGGRFYVANSGKTGIGTNNPSKTLHVYTADNEGIYLQGTSGGVWMDIKSAAGKIWSYGAQNDGCGIYNRTDGVYRMFIADSGATTFSSSVTASSFVKSGGTASQFLKADGSVDTNAYLTATSSDFTYNASLTLSTSWQNTGVTSANLPAKGTYIVTCYANDYSVGGSQYMCTYVGLMFWYTDGTNSVDTISEIPLHHSGHHDGGRAVFLRTLSSLNGDSKTYLQIKGNGNNSGASTYTFTFKRLL